MEIVRLSAIGILAALIAVELRSHRPVYGVLLIMATAVFMFVLSLDKINGLFVPLKQLGEQIGEHSYLVILLKALGMSYLCEITAGICQDAGFSSLASQIKIFVKIYIVVLGLPILLSFIEVLAGFGF